MEESFRHMLRAYFSFMKKDRIGIIVLTLLIVLAIACHYIIETIEISPRHDYAEIIRQYEAWEKEQKKEKEKDNISEPLIYFYFNPNTVSIEQLDSLDLPNFIKNNIIRYRAAGGKFNQPSDIRKIYGMNDSIFERVKPWLLFSKNIQPAEKEPSFFFDGTIGGTFDPNTVDGDELMRFGFNKFQISNLEKYRNKGGKFYEPADLLKIYGIDTNLFHAVREHICLQENTLTINEENVSKLLTLELNSADSAELVQLKGIGPVFASRIIKYRNLLGGYYSVDQLREVYGFPDETYRELAGSFITDTLKLIKVRVNFAGYTDLIRHPYLEKTDVEAILNYRNKNGPFITNSQLLSNGLIDSVSFSSMRPYLTCR